MEDQLLLFNDEMLLGIRANAKLIEVKKTNGLVKLNKEFLGIELGFLNKKELELLYILCLALKERKVQSIKIHIKEIKELMSSGEKEIRKTDLETYAETLHKRLAKVNIRTNKSGISGTLNLFEYVLTDTRDFETGIVTIIAKITDTAMNFFNNLEGKKNKYLRFLVEDAIRLKGKYSALLLPHLISCSKTKEFEITTENLEEILGIKGKYSRKTDFNKRVLKPTVEELEIIFKDLKVKGLKKNELDPRKITHYKFSWSNNINYDDKKEETSFFVEIEETNSNDKKEYSKVFISNDNVIDKTEEIEVAVADVKKEITEVEAEEEETDDLKECELYIKRNIFAEINFNSIKKEVKELIDNKGKEETLKYFTRTWKRLGEQQKKGKIKDRTAYFIFLIKKQLEVTPTEDEIREMARIEESRQYEERQKEREKKRKGNNKSDWDSPTEAEVKKEVTVTEDVTEIEIENIDYKKYQDIKKIRLKNWNNSSQRNEITEIYLMAQRGAFHNFFINKYTVTLTKSEWEKEIKDLAEIFYKNNIKETTEIYKNFFIIKEDTEVETEVAEAEEKVKEEKKLTKEEKFKNILDIIKKETLEYKEKYKEKIDEKEEKIKMKERLKKYLKMLDELDEEDEEEKKETEVADVKKEEVPVAEAKGKISNIKSNIKSIKDFTVKEVTDVKEEVAVADVKEKEIAVAEVKEEVAVAEVKVDVKKEVVVEEREEEEEEEELDLDNIVTNLFKK